MIVDMGRLTLVISAIAGVLGMFQSGFNLSSVNTPHPHIIDFLVRNFKARYGVDLSDNEAEVHYSAIISVYLVGSIVGGISGGWLADRYGRKRVLCVVQAFNIIGMAFCPFTLPCF